MRQTIPIVAVGLMMACGQADAPPASKPAADAPVEAAPDPAPAPGAAAERADGRVAVSITYCIP